MSLSIVKIKINNVTDKAIFAEVVGSGLSGMLHYKEISYQENLEDLKNSGNIVSQKQEILQESLKKKIYAHFRWF